MFTKEDFDKLTHEKKLKAIWEIRSFVTLNSVSKDTLKYMFDWLVDEALEEVPADE